jgi:hypothetical protein
MNLSGRQQQKKTKRAEPSQSTRTMNQVSQAASWEKKQPWWRTPARKMMTQVISMPRPKDGEWHT